MSYESKSYGSGQSPLGECPEGKSPTVKVLWVKVSLTKSCESNKYYGSKSYGSKPAVGQSPTGESPTGQSPKLSTLVTTSQGQNTTHYTIYTYTGFYTTTPPGPEPDPEFLVMVPMLILSLAGVYGNSVVIYTLSNLDKKSHHMLVMLSLAFSDFISCCFLMPCICLSSVTRSRPLGDRWCEIFPFLNTTVLNCSFGHLGLISFEQCFRLWNPNLYKQLVTRNIIKFICLLVWLFSAVGFLYPIRRLTTPMYYDPVYACLLVPKQADNIGAGISLQRAEKEKSILYGVTIGYKVLILLLMCFSYCLIFIKLSRGEHKERLRKRSWIGTLIRDKSAKSAVIMLAVITVFVYSWSPDFVLQILHMTRSLPKDWVTENPWTVRYTIYNYYLSPVLNPAIYSFGYKHVRQQMISSLKRSTKSKFVSLEDGPPLCYRTKSQVEKSELFYQKIDEIKREEKFTKSTKSPSTGSETSAITGIPRTINCRGVAGQPVTAYTALSQRGEPWKSVSGEWEYPGGSASTANFGGSQLEFDQGGIDRQSGEECCSEKFLRMKSKEGSPGSV
ncbi:hypothetical protein ACHWQZ_G000878 [Mnemiopsis leidyi]